MSTTNRRITSRSGYPCWCCPQRNSIKNQWLDLTKASVGPVNFDGQMCIFHDFRHFFMTSDNFRNLFGPMVDDCYWMDVELLHAFYNFRPICLGIFSKYWCADWVNGLLLLLLYCVHSDSLSDPQHFQFLCLPEQWTFEWWPQPNVDICFFICWDLIPWWNLSVPNCCGLLKLIKTLISCYAVWFAICRNLSGQELSVNSGSSCSFGILVFLQSMLLFKCWFCDFFSWAISSFTMYYSCQWNDLLIRIFSDTTVVLPRHATPVLTL